MIHFCIKTIENISAFSDLLKMTKFVALLALLGAAIAVADAAEVMCYFLRWTVYREGDGKFGAEDIDPTLCTYIIYSRVGINADGTILVQDEWEAEGLNELGKLAAHKKVNPDLRVIVSMGGYGEESENFTIVAADPDLRATLVEEILSFIDEHNFDGFELDWEYPNQGEGSDVSDKENYVILLSELKEALNAVNYTLIANVAGGIWSTGQSYNIPDVAENVDFLSIKTFGLHGSWEGAAGHPAPLLKSSLDLDNNNVEASIQYWIDGGAPVEKIILGISTQGQSYTLLDPEDNGLYAPILEEGTPGPYTASPGYLGYNEICELLGDWETIWDDEQMVPHKVNGDQWVGYDDVESVTLKAQYAKSLGLAGASVNSLDTDDFKGTCGEKPFPLLSTVYDIIMSEDKK